MSGIASVFEVIHQDERNLEQVQQILQSNPSLVKEFEDCGRSTLDTLLSNRNCPVAIIKLFLYYGADPNIKFCGKGPTPLYFALFCKNRVDIIRTLVEGGAKADQPDDICLSEALKVNAEIEVIKLLLTAGADLFRTARFGFGPIFYALNYFDVGAFRSLLDLQEVDVNTARNQANGSLLHSALFIDGCTPDFVKLLIDRGIKLDSMDSNDDTPLHVAVRNSTCDPAVVEVLLRNGSLVNLQNRSGCTPLDLAINIRDNPAIVQLLLNYYLLESSGVSVEDLIRRHKLKEVYSRYAKYCNRELQRMKLRYVGDGRTLHEFLIAYSGSQMSINSTEGFNVEYLFQIIAANLYPLYSNIISSKLDRSILKEKLLESNIYTIADTRSVVSCVTRKVLLKYGCVLHLSNYLDDKDLLSMVMAFSY